MEPSRDELIQLAEQSASLRAALERVRKELAVATAAEEALGDRLRALGIPTDTDDAKTTVDGVDRAYGEDRTATTRRTARRPEQAQISLLKAGAVGAALAIGVAIAVLLVVNLGRRAEPTPTAFASASPVPSTVASAPISPATSLAARDTPPPPSPDPQPPSLASAVIPKMIAPSAPTAPNAPSAPSAPSTGLLTIICLPKCDSINDNGVALSPSNLSNLTVSAGQHKLVLTTAAGIKRTIHTTVSPGQLREVRASMDAAGAPTPNYDRGF
jgi:hypothetical protein